MSIRKGSALLLIVCLTAWGKTPKESVERTIRHYNEAIIIAGKTGNTDVVKPFVSEKIAAKTHLWVMAWQDDNLRMDSKLLNFDITKMSIDSNLSQVNTHEIWNYQYDHPAKKEYYPKKTVIYDMSYSLYLHHGKWIISDVRVITEKESSAKKTEK